MPEQKVNVVLRVIRFFNGKKLFITGIVTIILGCLQDFDQKLILAGVTLIAGKSALKKLEK